jgi:CPA2 family monovalent cation:H+ antiporter-2
MAASDALMTYIVGGIVAAFGLGLLAHRLGVSPVVGYLTAGILIGPHTPGFVADGVIARQIADFGVILIMFGLGLKFSLSSLLAFRWRPVLGAAAQMLAVSATGYGLGLHMGFPPLESAIFGFGLSVASTVVLLRALEDNSLIGTHAGGVAICWGLVQDVATILALVIMPVMGRVAAGEIRAGDILVPLVAAAGQVARFVLAMLILGRRLLPPLLTFLIRSKLRELLSLGVFAIALGIAALAHEVFGVSFALGAFFAGLVLNEADLSHKAMEGMRPLRDAFAVLFFVSVGILFDPAVFATHFGTIIAVFAVITLGNALASFTMMSVMGMPAHQRLVVSAGLSQIGEFSFLLTGVCVGLGLMSAQAQALLVGGALMAISLHSFLFRWALALACRMPEAQDASAMADQLRTVAQKAEPDGVEEPPIRRRSA